MWDKVKERPQVLQLTFGTHVAWSMWRKHGTRSSHFEQVAQQQRNLKAMFDALRAIQNKWCAVPKCRSTFCTLPGCPELLSWCVLLKVASGVPTLDCPSTSSFQTCSFVPFRNIMSILFSLYSRQLCATHQTSSMVLLASSPPAHRTISVRPLCLQHINHQIRGWVVLSSWSERHGSPLPCQNSPPQRSSVAEQFFIRPCSHCESAGSSDSYRFATDVSSGQLLRRRRWRPGVLAVRQ